MQLDVHRLRLALTALSAVALAGAALRFAWHYVVFTEQVLRLVLFGRH